jgi:lambda family phage portal protein
MGLFENFIRWLSPSRALAREVSRQSLAYLEGRGYTAASNGRRFANTPAPQTSANAELVLTLPQLRGRSREFARNNPYVDRALEVIANNVVGTGVRAAFTVEKGKGAKNAEAKLKLAWNRWADKTECDFDGQTNLYGLQKLVMRAVAESGEALIIKRTNPTRRTLELQVLEGDFLDSNRHNGFAYGFNNEDGSYDFHGIRFDRDGRRIGYWLFDNHPGEYRGSFESRLVPADDVIHVFRRLRPGQQRGAPFGVAAFLRIKDYDDYEAAQLMRNKVAACFAAFVSVPSTGIPTNGEQFERIEPGMISYLNPGEDIRFGAPPQVEGYEPYSRQQLRAIAIAYGITYESLTGDLSNVNFSSGRMGWIEMHRGITSMQRDLMMPALDRVFQWFTDYLSIATGFTAPVYVEWTAPRREMIDPVKETRAIVESVQAGIRSYHEVCRELGFDPDDTLEEIKKFYDAIDASGLKLSSDFRTQMKPPENGLASDNSTGNAPSA